MNKTEQLKTRPILIWENSKTDGGGEATVQEVHTGAATGSTMPVIRIVSSGFGTHQAVNNTGSAVNKIRCAA